MKAASVEPDPELAALVGGGLGWRYAARIPAPVPAEALAWARACFEGAPRPMRTFLVVGWAALLLHGRARSDGTHVLGWPIRQATPRAAVLQRRSRLGVQATLLFVVQEDTVTFSSGMAFTNSLGRIVWAGVAPIHRWAVRSVLTHAATAIGRPN